MSIYSYSHTLAFSLLDDLNNESRNGSYSLEYDESDSSYELSFRPLDSDIFYCVNIVFDSCSLCDILKTLLRLTPFI